MTRSRSTGKAAKRSGGKLPPHVMVYFAMALALFASDDNYEEVAARLAARCKTGTAGMRPGRSRRRAGSPRPGSGWGMSRFKSCSPRWRSRLRRS